jgi:hypothetical protein
VFKHEVEIFFVHKCHDELYNEGTVDQHFQSILLAHHSLGFLFLDQVCLVQLLDCNKLVALFMQSKVDLPERPLSNIFVEFEVLNGNSF